MNATNRSKGNENCYDKKVGDIRRFGGEFTFFETSKIFYIIGLGFGTSYSLVKVD